MEVSFHISMSWVRLPLDYHCPVLDMDSTLLALHIVLNMKELKHLVKYTDK